MVVTVMMPGGRRRTVRRIDAAAGGRCRASGTLAPASGAAERLFHGLQEVLRGSRQLR